MAANAKTDEQRRILLKPRQAAQACNTSERWLWQHSQPRGPIPCLRIGGLVRYCPEALKRFFESQQQAPQQAEEEFRQQVEDQFNAALDHPVNAGLKAHLTASQALARDISHLGGGPEEGGNDDCMHPPTRTCNRCKPA